MFDIMYTSVYQAVVFWTPVWLLILSVKTYNKLRPTGTSVPLNISTSVICQYSVNNKSVICKLITLR